MTALHEQFKNKNQSQLNQALIEVCELGDLDKVKCLLTSPDLKLHAQIDTPGAFMKACVFENKEIVEYLLSSDELSQKISIENAFLEACILKSYSALSFMIFELNIKQTEFMKNRLVNIYPDIKQMFELREINKSLNKELPSAKINKKNKLKL